MRKMEKVRKKNNKREWLKRMMSSTVDGRKQKKELHSLTSKRERIERLTWTTQSSK